MRLDWCLLALFAVLGVLAVLTATKLMVMLFSISVFGFVAVGFVLFARLYANL